MKRKFKIVFLVLLFLAMLVGSVVYIATNEIVVLNPKGWIAERQRTLLIISTLLMLIVVIPVFIITIFFAWKYRESNTKAKYSPDVDHNHLAEVIWWGLPFIIIVVMSVITYKSCHELDPFKPLNSTEKPLRIQAVALDWKWLFLYPDLGIATVNIVQFPEKTPLNFEITSDAPMNSFWIPALGGQMYAMAGMRSKLHLIANEPGTYRGSSANISGRGFAGMWFTAKSTTRADFDEWVKSVKASSTTLDSKEYDQLAQPSERNPPATYVLEQPDLFDQIVMKYMMPMEK